MILVCPNGGKADNANKGGVYDAQDLKGMFSNGIEGLLTSTRHEGWFVKQKMAEIVSELPEASKILKKLYINAKGGWVEPWTP